MLKGRLGLETARIPQADRHGLLWLARGNLTVEDGRPGAVILRMLALDRASGGPGPGLMITCDLPRSRAEICVAALTHRFVEIMGRAGASAQVLDRAARQIRAYVPSRLR